MNTNDFNRYQRAAMITLAPEVKADKTKALNNAALGLAGEAGEVADHVKKVLFQGHTLDVAKVSKELGDILWYIAEAAWALDLPMALIADENIAKLAKRYPEGFTVERSVNRAE